MSLYQQMISLVVFSVLATNAYASGKDDPKIRGQTWEHLRKRIYPYIGVEMPPPIEYSPTNYIHVLLFNDQTRIYRCDFFQTSNVFFSVSSIYMARSERDRPAQECQIHCKTNLVHDGIWTMFMEQMKKVGKTKPEGRPMAVGHPNYLVLISAINGDARCFYYDSPHIDQDERQITPLIELAYMTFMQAEFDQKSHDHINRVLYGKTLPSHLPISSSESPMGSGL